MSKGAITKLQDHKRAAQIAGWIVEDATAYALLCVLTRANSHGGMRVKLTKGDRMWSCVLSGLPLDCGISVRATNRNVAEALAGALALCEEVSGKRFEELPEPDFS